MPPTSVRVGKFRIGAQHTILLKKIPYKFLAAHFPFSGSFIGQHHSGIHPLVQGFQSCFNCRRRSHPVHPQSDEQKLPVKRNAIYNATLLPGMPFNSRASMGMLHGIRVKKNQAIPDSPNQNPNSSLPNYKPPGRSIRHFSMPIPFIPEPRRLEKRPPEKRQNSANLAKYKGFSTHSNNFLIGFS